MITQDYLKSILNYDPSNGVFIWIVRKSKSIKQFDIAGSLDNLHGYIFIRIDGVNYRAHRLAWLYMRGFMPNIIDHIDGVKTNNSFSNLREATNSQNGMNVGIQSNNKTGYKGVSFCTINKKFRAQAKVKGVSKKLGYFNTAEEASKVYENFAKLHHGEFYRSPVMG